MRFSIWPTAAQPWDDILEITAHCEQTGWDGVYFADHFMPNGPGPDALGTQSMVPYGHTFQVGRDSLRAALDATVLSRTGRAVGVDAENRVQGITTYERLRAAIQTAEEAGLRDPGQVTFREGRTAPAGEAQLPEGQAGQSGQAAEAQPAGEGAHPS